MKVKALSSLALLMLVFFMAAPSAAQPLGNHYTCYQVKDRGVPAKFVSPVITTTDQHGNQVWAKCKPKFLCMPAIKNGGPIIDPALHYCCYQCKGFKLPALNYDIVDQFGPLRLEVKNSKLVCNPCNKVPAP